ncbi:MAG: TetR/AcrR family transcriptional regulator [Gemmatimonadota bacterium]
MPKISAATVPEHRARQRRALIAAAVDILAESGAAAVTPAAVGARAGLARSSVYQYFPSTAALLATLVEEAFADWNATVATAMAQADSPAGRIDAYLTAALRLAAAGGHRAAAALYTADLPPECRRRVGELHREEAEPLAAAIRDLGVPDPGLTGQLLAGLLQAAMTAVEGGADPAAVTARMLALLHGGLRPR